MRRVAWNAGQRAVAAAFAALFWAGMAAAQTRPPTDTARVPRAAPRAAANPASDSVIQQLLRLQGYVPVEYAGERAEYRTADGVLRLQGKQAEVTRLGEKVTADTILYRRGISQVEALGKPKVSGQAQQIEGNLLVYNFDTGRATVKNAKTKVTEGASWLVQGDVTAETRDGTQRLYTTAGCFTTDERYGSCAPESGELPQYKFVADRILVIKDKRIVARPVRLYFKNVPVFWLPFIVQNLERGRQSGVLVPEFGVSDIVQTGGNNTRQISNVGYYWAINDYLGAKLAGGWRSGVYTSLLGDLQFRSRRQFLDGNVSYQQYWKEGGGQESTTSGRAAWQPTERTRLNVQGNYASSSGFVRRNTTDPFEVSQNLNSALALTHEFDWGGVSFGAERRQSITDGRVDWVLPSVGFSPKAITLFRSATPEQASWYSNATLTFSGSGSRALTDVVEDTANTLRDSDRTQLSLGQNLTVGRLRLNTNASLNRNLLGAKIATGDVLLEEVERQEGTWNSSISYDQKLIGSTQVSPTLQLNQSFVKDTLTGGEYVGGATRMSFGAGLNTDLFGLFPGIGAYTAFRHKISPRFTYAYAPQVEQSELQKRVFGDAGGRTQNRVSLDLSTTIEAKLRPQAVKQPQDSVRGDSVVGASPAARPQTGQPRTVTLLSLSGPSLVYDFAKAATGESGFETQEISTSISSDYLRGLQINLRHDLFDESMLDRNNPNDQGKLGEFSPFLTAVSTQFSLGPGSALFRWLGLGGENAPATANPPTPQGIVPGTDFPSIDAPGSTAATANPRATGGGNWNLSVQYSLQRNRADRTPLVDGSTPRLGGRTGEGQTLNGNLSFPLTPKWAVNWATSYSITDSEFGIHRLTLRRDLYRWQADFNFNRTPAGVTSFDVAVRLKDLPDLKFDYRENNLGDNRRR